MRTGGVFALIVNSVSDSMAQVGDRKDYFEIGGMKRDILVQNR